LDRSAILVRLGGWLDGRIRNERTLRTEIERPLGIASEGPIELVAPGAGGQGPVGGRPVVALDVDGNRWLLHHAGGFAFQPVGEEALHLMPDVDWGTGPTVVGAGVRPRADQRLPGAAQVLEGAQHRVRVPIAPAADQEGRAGDRVVVLAQRPILPLL